jgi:hypothetical protein
MTRRRLVAAAFGLVLVAIVAGVWVVPAVRGPEVTCVDIDPVACDQAWRSAVARTGYTIFPLTKVRVYSTCPQMYLGYGPLGIFVQYIESFC